MMPIHSSRRRRSILFRTHQYEGRCQDSPTFQEVHFTQHIQAVFHQLQVPGFHHFLLNQLTSAMIVGQL
uniref:Uncharacterized protein n=1 Tax=Picea sitchensis TaxID=3332 RepID=A9NMF7_PICSI|nr:unknown [Picea sitchensis]